MVFLKKYFQYILILVSTIGCTDKQTEFNDIMYVDNEDVLGKFDVSDLVESIEFIELKEKEESFVGGIYKFFWQGGKFIVFDRFKAQKIFLFSSDGTFLKEIIKIGQAPDEAMQINDCWYNNDRELEVYDFAQKKIFRYDTLYNLKEVVKSGDMNIYTSLSTLPSSDRYVAYSSYNNPPYKEAEKSYHNMIFLDRNLNILGTELSYDKKFDGVNWLTFSNHFFRYGDSLRFIRAYDNYIYTVSEEGITKKTKLRFSKSEADEGDLKKMMSKNLDILRRNDLDPNDQHKFLNSSVSLLSPWFEKERYIMFMYSNYDGRNVLSFYDKKNKNRRISTRMFSAEREYAMILPYFVYTDPDPSIDTFYGIIPGYDAEMYFTDPNKFNEKDWDPESFYIVKVIFKNI